MKSKLLLGILSLLLLRATGVAASYKPVTVVDGIVIQPAVGFSGISFSIPPGYYRYSPLKKGTRTNENAQWAWSMSTDSSRSAGSTSLEHITFSKRNRGIGITVAINKFAKFVPGMRDRLSYRAVVESTTGFLQFEQGKVEFRDSREIGDKYVGRVTRDLPEYARYNAVYIILLPPRYELMINGVSASKDRTELMSDIEALIASLQFSVPKK